MPATRRLATSRGCGVLAAALLCACVRPPADPTPPPVEPPAGVLASLEAALQDGSLNPSAVVSSGRFAALLADPATRSVVRELLARHTRDSRVTMVGPGEPGTPLGVRVRVVDGSSGAPVPGALVELVHVDASGVYQPDDRTWNPRLFGHARTGADGRARFTTIRPPYYRAGSGPPDEPAHIHYTVSRAGYRPFAAEITFDDDPRMTPARRAAAARHDNPVARPQVDATGRAFIEVTLPLQAG